MIFQALTLSRFRNHHQADFTFSEGFNLITGQNGVGKTAILESLYYLSLLRFPNGIHEKNIIENGHSYFRISTLVRDAIGEKNIVAFYSNESGKTLKINENEIKKLSEHVGSIPLIMICPEDIELIRQYSDGRRKLMDIVFSQISKEYLHSLIRYNRLLKNRNILIRNYKLQTNNSIDNDLISSINIKMADEALNINNFRNIHTKEINSYLKHFYTLITNGSELAELSYSNPFMDIDYHEIFNKSFPADLMQGRTTVGIQKEDYIFIFNQGNIKTKGSQGQQKTYLFALKLALYKLLLIHVKKNPILLLDDVGEKLDNMRIKELFGILDKELKSQIFITDTVRSPIPKLHSSINHIKL